MPQQFANTPGPLELLPGSWYGSEWLRLVDKWDKLICSWPVEGETSLDSIYLQPDRAWWRLVNPRWVNPAHFKSEDGAGIDSVMERLRGVSDFVKAIEGTFHPTQSYASYCDSSSRLSYGEVVFKIDDGEMWKTFKSTLPPPEKWQLVSDDGKGVLQVRAGNRTWTLKLQPASANGDETVPSDRSARSVAGTRFVHGISPGTGYEHQNSYSDAHVRKSMLYSIVQIAKTAKWSK